MKMQLETTDHSIVKDLLEISENTADQLQNTEFDFEGVAKIIFLRKKQRRAFDHPALYEFLLQISSNISCGLIASWLYDKLRNRSLKLKIDGNDTALERTEIQKSLEKAIENKKRK